MPPTFKDNELKALTQMRAVTHSALDELGTELEGLSISAFVSTGPGRQDLAPHYRCRRRD